MLVSIICILHLVHQVSSVQMYKLSILQYNIITITILPPLLVDIIDMEKCACLYTSSHVRKIILWKVAVARVNNGAINENTCTDEAGNSHSSNSLYRFHNSQNGNLDLEDYRSTLEIANVLFCAQRRCDHLRHEQKEIAFW